MKREIIDEITSLTESERAEILRSHRENGVKIPFDSGVFIGKTVKIESGAVILQGSVLTGKTTVEKDCVIGPDTWLFDTDVKAGAMLNSVQAAEAQIGENADIGPFVHIRPNSTVKKNVHLGNFVEVKNSVIDDGTKVSHLTYVGDSDVGKNVNFGCGCVTVNYNGKKKFRTTIGDHAFIGCNTNLIAPVTVGDYGYTAARLHNHRRRARKRARHCTRPPGEQARLGNKKEALQGHGMKPQEF